MKLLSLTINSFTPLRFGPVTLPLDRQGLVLIEGDNRDSLGWSGSNRAGKSALFESIPWCWWGKMPRYGDRRLGDEPCHPIHGADVAVEFRITDDEVFRTRRVKMPGKSAKFTVEVSTPGATWKPVTGSALHAYEADMASLLGFTYDTFRAALFLQASGFTVTTAGFTSQLKLLESVLRFDTLTEAGERASKRSSAAASSLAIAKSELASLQREIEGRKTEITRLESLDEEKTELSLRDELLFIDVDLKEIGLGVEAAERLHAEAKTELRRLFGLVDKADIKLERFREDKSKAEKLMESPTCPVCSAKIRKQHLVGLIHEAESSIATEEANREIAATSHDAQLAELEKAENLLDKVKALTRDQAVKERELAAVRQRRSGLAAMIQAARERLDEKLTAAEGKAGEITGLDWIATVAKFWVRGFGSDGLKAEILGAGTPVLNAAAHRYSEILTDGDIKVEFDPFRSSRVEDLIRIKINGVPVKYETCSSSERRRVDIIVALSHRALARWRLARPVNVGLADELFDTLDDQGLQRVMAVIQQDMDELSSLFVVSHNAALKAMFPGARTWLVRRTGGEAKVYVG